MVNEIITRLREGSIPHVVLYADVILPPSTPYVMGAWKRHLRY